MYLSPSTNAMRHIPASSVGADVHVRPADELRQADISPLITVAEANACQQAGLLCCENPCPPSLGMAEDVRRHYTDTGWIDRLAIVTNPEKRPVIFTARSVSPGGTASEDRRQYWTGSVQFGDAGNRNVLLEPVDADGTRRWYLIGRNGERLSQYVERRYAGRLAQAYTPSVLPRQGGSSDTQAVNDAAEMAYDQPEAKRFRSLNSAQPASPQFEGEEFQPEQFVLPSHAVQAMRRLAKLGLENPAAAAAAVMKQRGGAHIGAWIAALTDTFSRSAEVPLGAYLELVNALHASGHLTSEEVQSLLLPEKEGERHLPISAAVASHWQSGVAQPFVSTLANATPESGKEQVVSRLCLKQSDRHHRQIRMQYPADFYRQIKRGIDNLSAGQRDTPALRRLAEHGLIPPKRELGKIVKKLPAVAPTTASPMRTMRDIATLGDDVMPAVVAQEVQKQQQDAALEKARTTYQENWQAATRAQEAQKCSPMAALIAGFSSQLHAQGADVRSQKQQHIAQWEQAQEARRRLEGRQYQQKRDRALAGSFATRMCAGRATGPARSSAGKEPEYAVPQASRQSGQREEQLREAQRAIGRQVAQDAAAAAANLHRLQTQEIMSRAPATSILPVPGGPAAAQTLGQRVAAAEYLNESGQPHTQTFTR